MGTTSGTNASSGGIEVVESGGTAVSTTVLSGGEIVVYAGANVSGLSVRSGGTEIVLSSGGTFNEVLRAAIPVDGAASHTASDSASQAPSAAAVESTVANLIQAMARFEAGTGHQGALFDPANHGLFDERGSMLVVNHHGA